MGKATVFLSHSSKDAAMMRKLKQELDEKTHRTVRFFLSCDGQSIPFGRNWVAEIEKALDDSSLLFCFVTPRSVNSNWLYFEAGFAYARGAKVVPVGFSGVNLATVPPPISLLQGFNIRDHHTLNNLLTIINEHLESEHPLAFSESDFREITGQKEFSEHEEFCNEYFLETIKFKLFFSTDPENLLVKTFQKGGYEPEVYRGGNKSRKIICPGLEIRWQIMDDDIKLWEQRIEICKVLNLSPKQEIFVSDFVVFPKSFDSYLECFDKILKSVLPLQKSVHLFFLSEWRWIKPRNAIFACLHETIIKRTAKDGCKYEGHRFTTPYDNIVHPSGKDEFELFIDSSFSALPIRKLLNQLLSLGAIHYSAKNRQDSENND